MADIFTKSQIHGYSLKVLFFAIGLCFGLTSLSQVPMSNSKKANKYFEKGSSAVKERNFPEAIYNFKKSIEKDPGFATAYKRLGSIYSLYRQLDSAFLYLSGYADLTPTAQLSSKEVYSLANMYYNHGYYKKSSELIEYAISTEVGWLNDHGKIRLKESVDFSLKNSKIGSGRSFKVLPESVNAFNSQYFPAITVDGGSLFFTRRLGSGPREDEDLVVSYLKDGEWTEATSVSDIINSQYNEGACTISADGRTLIFTSCEANRTFGSCDLFITSKKGETWSKPINMGTAINSPFWDSQPSLSADGRTLYFSSNRKGGFGQRDIWVSRKKSKTWGTPVNLGRGINTELDETTPHIHANHQTLFFSSEGHIGFGGFDLFKVDQVNDSVWSIPKNLGFGINDYHDQLSLIVSADGLTGYFAVEKLENSGVSTSKIAEVDFSPGEVINHKASYVTGQTLDAKTMLPLETSISLYDLETDQNRYQTFSDPETGRYFFVLTEGDEFGAFAKSAGYLFEDFLFSVEESSLLEPDTIDILLTPIEKDLSMILENVFFEFDSYVLDSKSQTELRIVSDFLKENNLKVEISGHTDNVGEKGYNKRLSVQRAQSVYNYLIKEGVPIEKLVYAGYGSTQPKYENRENDKNRRIEFRILSFN